jgi:phosphoserine phosphatase
VTAPEAVWPLVTVDVDGTLTTVHGWQVIADALGRRAEFDRSRRRFFAREIDEDQHLAEMLEVAADAPLSEVETALATTPRIDRITEGIAAFHAAGSRVALLTHNPPFVCAWYRDHFGFDDFEGTGAQEIDHGVIRAPHNVRADKRGGLERLTSRSRVAPSQVVHIGDGWADAAVFPLVGAGVALNSTLPDVERAADLVLRTNDFRDVAAGVRALAPRG